MFAVAKLTLITKFACIYKEEDKNLNVRADRQKIAQVVMNIISNSIKYSPAGGEIIVKIKKDGNNILVSCNDNGIGIPEKDLANVFSRFYRVSGIASSFSGSGIGLYISSTTLNFTVVRQTNFCSQFLILHFH